MGVYNPDERQLKEAVRSICAQTVKDWEMILYDDGSDREHAEIIRRVSHMDKRIRWIRNNQNHGLAYALNEGLRLAEGMFIARMDDDDIALPDRFEKQCRFLEEHPEFQWTGTNAELFDDAGVWGKEKMPRIPKKEDFLKYSPYIHPSVMFRRDILEKAGGYCVSEATKRCEDYELFMRMHAAGYRGYNLQEYLLLYREDKKSYGKRILSCRLYEMKIRRQGFQRLRIPTAARILYTLRPLAGSLPGAKKIRRLLRRKKHVIPFTEQ